MNIQELMNEASETAIAHGFRDGPGKTFAEDIALMHSELSEALEEYRDNKLHMYKIHAKDCPAQHAIGKCDFCEPKPEGAVIELADAMIRIAETAKFYNMDLVGALRTKMDYNKTRSYKHGRVNL